MATIPPAGATVERFRRYVAYRLWKAAWADTDPSIDDLDALADDIFCGPEAEEVILAGLDPVVIALGEARRGELVGLGPEGGVLSPDSSGRLLTALVERLLADDGVYWKAQFTEALKIADGSPLGPLYRDVLELMGAPTRSRVRRTRPPRPAHGPPPPTPPQLRTWVRGTQVPAMYTSLGEGQWAASATAVLDGLTCTARVTAVDQVDTTEFTAYVDKHADLVARLVLGLSRASGFDTKVVPVTANQQRLVLERSTFKSLSIEIMPMLRIATLAHAEANSYFVRSNSRRSGTWTAEVVDPKGGVRDVSRPFYMDLLKSSMENAFPGIDPLQVELRLARSEEEASEGPSLTLAFIVDYLMRQIVSRNKERSKDTALYSGVNNELSAYDENISTWKHAQNAVFVLVMGQVTDSGACSVGEDVGAYHQKIDAAARWLATRPCRQAVCLVPTTLASAASKKLPPGVRVEGVASLQDLPRQLAELVRILAEGP